MNAQPEKNSGQPGRTRGPAQTPSIPTSPSAHSLSSPSAHSPGTSQAPDRLHLVKFAPTRGRYYAAVLAVFCCILLISNISATKVIGFGPIVTDGGAFLFPFAYILGDVISEVYGFAAARKAVILGFLMQVLASVVFWLVIISPAGPGYENQAAFAAVLGFVPRIVAASLCGYVVGQLLNSLVLVKVKRRMGEGRLWVRLLTSTGVGEFADTLLFCIVAFAGVIPGMDFINYVIVGFVYKCAVEVLFLPVTYQVIKVFKRHELAYSEDVDRENITEGSRV